jgi:hypothetical protein
MKKALLLIVSVCTAAAAVHPIQVPFESLELIDGRTFKNGSFKSFDDVKRTVTIFADRKALTVPLASLPQDYVAKIKARVPERSPEEIAEEKKQREAEARAAQKKQDSRTTKKEGISDEIDRDRRKAALKTADREEEYRLKLPELVLRAAEVRAQNFFAGERYELYTPEMIPGWEGRWRVPGRVWNYRRKGSGYPADRDIDVTVEAKGKQTPRVLDIEVH